MKKTKKQEKTISIAREEHPKKKRKISESIASHQAENDSKISSKLNELQKSNELLLNILKDVREFFSNNPKQKMIDEVIAQAEIKS